MRNYVLAFMIDLAQNKILLIKKNRPAWQAGKLNGIGGKIEGQELPIQAIIREVEEETGLVTFDNEWTNFGQMNLIDGGAVYLFRSFREDLANAVSITDEEVIIRSIDLNDLRSDVMPNLIWLIESSLDSSISYINVNLN